MILARIRGGLGVDVRDRERSADVRIMVMGSGGVGGYFGAVLHRAGHEVTFVARGEHLEAIRARGLRIESVASGDFTVRPAATDTPDQSLGAELVLYCVKGYDNAAAIDTMAPAVGADTRVLTLQNGIGSGDRLADAFGADKVLLGVTYIDVVRTEPGVVAEVGDKCNIVFGEQDGQHSPRAVAVRDAMKDAGIDVHLSSNVAEELWKKLIYICAWSGMICMTRASMAEITGTPEANDLTLRIMREVEAVARASGVDLDPGHVDRTMAYFQKTREGAVSSMFTDLQRGNRLEVDVLNGAVARLGVELGVPTPGNEFIAGCLAVAHNRALSQLSAGPASS
jgi:2-dehydropantoate 2-reductase